MGKALHVRANNAAGVCPSGTFDAWGAGGSAASNATESNSQLSIRQAGTFSRLGYNNQGGSGTNTVTFRVAGADGNDVATGTGTGWQEDTTHTDVISANTLVGFAFTDTGTDPSYSALKVLFESSGDHCCYHVAVNPNSSSFSAASTTRFQAFYGTMSVAVAEANTQVKARATGTLRSFQVRVTGNARTTQTDFKTRIDGADGNGLVSFAAGITGLVVDDSGTDTISDGALFNSSITTGSGTEIINISIVAAAITSASPTESDLAKAGNGNNRTGGATANYSPIGGTHTINTRTVEAECQLKPGFGGTARNLRVNISANSLTGDMTLKVMKNGTAALTLTITATTTGWIENSSDTLDFLADDTLSYEWDEGTSGSITLQSAVMTLLDTGGEPPATDIPAFMVGGGGSGRRVQVIGT